MDNLAINWQNFAQVPKIQIQIYYCRS